MYKVIPNPLRFIALFWTLHTFTFKLDYSPSAIFCYDLCPVQWIIAFDEMRENAFKQGPGMLWFGWYGEHVLG